MSDRKPERELDLKLQDLQTAIQHTGEEDDFNTLLWWFIHNPGITTPIQIARVAAEVEVMIAQSRAVQAQKQAFVLEHQEFAERARQERKAAE